MQMRRSNIPIVRHIPKFLEYCEVEKGLSPVSAKNYDNFLRMFVQWLADCNLAHLKPHELTPDQVWNYRLYLSRKRDRGGAYIKKTTQSYYLIALRNLLNYFTDKDIAALPAEKIKLPKLTDKDKAIKFLRFEQLEKLLAAPDISKVEGLRDRAILEVLFSTGMRVSELTSLNVNLFSASQFTGAAPKELELSITGKGGRARTVYFSTRALFWLGKYLRSRRDSYPPLFINYRPDKKDLKHRLTDRSVQRLVRKYTHISGLSVEVTPHTLRHSFATDLLSQGAELLGHKNIGTTQIYTHITNPALREIHRRFHSGRKQS